MTWESTASPAGDVPGGPIPAGGPPVSAAAGRSPPHDGALLDAIPPSSRTPLIDEWAALLADAPAESAAHRRVAEALGAVYDAGFIDGVRRAVGGLVLDVHIE
ncbi:MAG: hypothetical protein RJQ03_06085 [Miltoncostaeaceae bacterium]